MVYVIMAESSQFCLCFTCAAISIWRSFVFPAPGKSHRIKSTSYHQGVSHQVAQKQLSQNLMSNASNWWNTRLDKRSSRHQEYWQKNLDAVLYLNGRFKRTWAHARPPTLAVQLRSSLDRASSGGVGRLGADELLQRLCEDGQLHKALNALFLMDQQGIIPSVQAYRSLLKVCTKRKDLIQAKRVHAHLAQHGFESIGYLGESVVGTLVKCGGLEDALQVFHGLLHRTVSSWTAVISGYAMSGRGKQALIAYQRMLEDGVVPNTYTFVCLLKACVSIADLEEGRRIHAETSKYMCDSDLFVRTSLVDMYAKCGSLEDAQNVFDGLLQRDLVSWNAMLAAYAQQGQPERVLKLYKRFKEEGVSPNDRTFVSILQACGLIAEKEEGELVDGLPIKVMSLKAGRAIHFDAQRKGYDSDVFVGSTLVSMYGKCGSIKDAHNVFDKLSERNVVSWNAMLVAYIQQGKAEKALQLYDQMRENFVSPNDRTFVSMLQACRILAEQGDTLEDDGMTKLKSLEKGRQIHVEAQRQGYNSNMYVGNSLFSMYLTCGSIVDARIVFDGLSDRNVVTWTVMLAAYIEHGQGEMALQLYRQMKEESVTPDEIALVSVLQACSNTGTLNMCRQIHCTLVFDEKLSPPLINTLIHAYGRCGSMADAQSLFDAVPQPNVVSWTALVAGYARQGEYAASLQFYEEMQMAGIKPDGVTFLCILAVCNHVGLVEKGLEYFESMSRDHGVIPGMEHYVTIVDLLGRAGYFTGIQNLFSTMPGQPDLAMWVCLLGACRKHGEVVLGRHAFDGAVRLQPKHGAAYILMWNIYADVGLWDCAKEVEELQQRAGALKQPGRSWIEDGQGIHTFVVGCSNQHPQQELWYEVLGQVSLRLKDEGHFTYMPYTLVNFGDRGNDQLFYGHSEKLAMAFGSLL